MDNLYNRVARRRRKGEGGFTLIELLVVIAVLAILAAIVIFNVIGVGKAGKTASCNTDLKSIQTAVDTYYNANTEYPTADHLSTVGEAIVTGDISPTYIHGDPANLEANTGAVTMLDTAGSVKAANC